MKVKDKPSCQGCPMLKVDYTYTKAGREIRHIGADQNFVPPRMGNSLRLSVWEAPGETENEKCEPAVGAAGKFGDVLYRKAGVQRDELTILNCINCRPPNNIFPTDAAARKFISAKDAQEAVSHCYREHVEPVLRSRPWQRIDAVGAESLKILTGKTDGITKWRGSPLALKGEELIRVIPTLHPSYIMQYGQSAIPDVISDLKKGTQVPPEHYNLHPTVDDVLAFRNSKNLTLDIETNIFTNQITMVGLCSKPHHVTVAPFRGPYIEALKQVILTCENLIGHNVIMFDIPHLFEALGIEWQK